MPGGGGGGMPSKLSSTHKPRDTGAVRSGIRGDHQHAAETKHAAANTVGEGDAAKSLAIHIGHAVVTREPFVEKRIVGGHELDDAPVGAQLAVDEELCFLHEGVAEVLIELRVGEQIRLKRGGLADRQPLTGEVVDQRARARIGEHPADLLRRGRPVG